MVPDPVKIEIEVGTKLKFSRKHDNANGETLLSREKAVTKGKANYS